MPPELAPPGLPIEMLERARAARARAWTRRAERRDAARASSRAPRSRRAPRALARSTRASSGRGSLLGWVGARAVARRARPRALAARRARRGRSLMSRRLRARASSRWFARGDRDLHRRAAGARAGSCCSCSRAAPEPQLLVVRARASALAGAARRAAGGARRRAAPGSAPSGRCRSCSPTRIGHGLHACAAGCARRPTSPARTGSRSCSCSRTSACSRRCARARGAATARARSRPRRVAAALVVALARLRRACVCAQLEAEIARRRPSRAGVVQADLAHYERARARELGTLRRRARRSSTRTSRSRARRSRAAPLDLLVWPETVYPTTFGAPKSADGAAFDREIAAFVARHGRAAGVRRLRRRGRARVQRRGLPRADAATGACASTTYRKASLFPLTERVPALLDRPARARAGCPGSARWTPGAGAARRCRSRSRRAQRCASRRSSATTRSIRRSRAPRCATAPS